MTKWMTEQLLPSLLQKQNAKGADHIYVTERQTECLMREFRRVESGITSVRVHFELEWETRILRLFCSNNGGTLYIGKTEKEREQLERDRRTKELEHRKEHLARIKERHPDKYAEKLASIQREIAELESYDDLDSNELAYLNDLKYIIA